MQMQACRRRCGIGQRRRRGTSSISDKDTRFLSKATLTQVYHHAIRFAPCRAQSVPLRTPTSKTGLAREATGRGRPPCVLLLVSFFSYSRFYPSDTRVPVHLNRGLAAFSIWTLKYFRSLYRDLPKYLVRTRTIMEPSPYPPRKTNFACILIPWTIMVWTMSPSI